MSLKSGSRKMKETNEYSQRQGSVLGFHCINSLHQGAFVGIQLYQCLILEPSEDRPMNSSLMTQEHGNPCLRSLIYGNAR